MVVQNCDAKSHAWTSKAKTRFANFVEALRPMVSRATESDVRRRIAEAVKTISATTAHFVRDVRAFSPELVDELLALPSFHMSLATFFSAASKLPPTKYSSGGPGLEPTFANMPRHAERAKQLNEMLRQVAATHKSGKMKPVTFTVHATTKQREQDLFWFAYEPTIPADIADAMMGHLESETAYIMAHQGGKQWSEDDRIALLDFRARTFRRWARFLASCEGSQIPAIPPEEHMNLDEILARHKTACANLEAQTPRVLEEIAR